MSRPRLSDAEKQRAYRERQKLRGFPLAPRQFAQEITRKEIVLLLCHYAQLGKKTPALLPQAICAARYALEAMDREEMLQIARGKVAALEQEDVSDAEMRRLVLGTLTPGPKPAGEIEQ